MGPDFARASRRGVIAGGRSRDSVPAPADFDPIRSAVGDWRSCNETVVPPAPAFACRRGDPRLARL